MQLKLWHIDSFAQKTFEGNPAGVVPLSAWLDDALMQKIAGENNLAETAFFVPRSKGVYGLRWFTPTTEVDLCGHATLASAWVLFQELERDLREVRFETRSGTLVVERGHDGWHATSLPSDHVKPAQNAKLAGQIAEALACEKPSEVHLGRNVFAVFDDPAAIRGLKGPGDVARAIPEDKGLIVTSKGDRGYDFISRYFAPHHGVPEDPVTGSAHCALTPYWSARLGKKTLKARQVSPRGGDLLCTDAGDRTILSGPCALYLRGEISV